MEKLIIGSRGSKLALKYAEIAKKAFLKELDIEIEIKKITTDGDLVLDRRTSEIGGKGEFIKNIEKELISKNIDVAVHSLKDVPSVKTKGLVNKTCIYLSISNCFFKSLPAFSAILRASSILHSSL